MLVKATNVDDSNSAPIKFMLIGSFALSMFKFRKDLLKSMIVREVDVHVVLPDTRDDGWVAAKLEEMGVTVHRTAMARTGMNPFGDLSTLLGLWRLLKDVRPSHVLSYTIKPIIYGSLAAWFAGVPHRFALVTGRGYAFENGRGRLHVGGLAQRMYKVGLSRVATVMFQNSDDESLFLERGLISANSRTCVVNGSGVNLDEFPVTPLPQGASFLIIARLLGAKGVREFVAAARQVINEGHSAMFKAVGWIDENPDSISEEELETWKSEGIVEFLGKQTDVIPAITASSVYVLPSYREGTPRTVLEAMSMGRPVITTDAPGCREAVTDGDNGFLVPVQSVDELAAAMIRFVEDPDLAVRMGLRSREIAEERYDVHKVNEVMLEVMGIR
jgi:glycosyltransferase involved in cell wall biosynthesis